MFASVIIAKVRRCPFQNQMINGADKSGITIFKMDEYIDNGPIFYQAEFDIKNLELDDFIN